MTAELKPEGQRLDGLTMLLLATCLRTSSWSMRLSWNQSCHEICAFLAGCLHGDCLPDSRARVRSDTEQILGQRKLSNPDSDKSRAIPSLALHPAVLAPRTFSEI